MDEGSFFNLVNLLSWLKLVLSIVQHTFWWFDFKRQVTEHSKSEESYSYLDQQALEDAVSFKRKQQRQRICDCHGVSADECNCYQCEATVFIRKVSGLAFVGHLQDWQQSKADILFRLIQRTKSAHSELEPHHQSGHSFSHCEAVCAMWCYDCSLSSKGGVEASALGPHLSLRRP